MNNNRFYTAEVAFGELISIESELIEQGFDELHESVGPDELADRILIDKTKKIFFFADAESEKTLRDAVKELHNETYHSTNLKKVKQWKQIS